MTLSILVLDPPEGGEYVELLPLFPEEIPFLTAKHIPKNDMAKNITGAESAPLYVDYVYC